MQSFFDLLAYFVRSGQEPEVYPEEFTEDKMEIGGLVSGERFCYLKPQAGAMTNLTGGSDQSKH